MTFTDEETGRRLAQVYCYLIWLGKQALERSATEVFLQSTERDMEGQNGQARCVVRAGEYAEATG